MQAPDKKGIICEIFHDPNVRLLYWSINTTRIEIELSVKPVQKIYSAEPR